MVSAVMLRGVVVSIMRGSSPSRMVISAMSNAVCGWRHLANSSPQTPSNWWPRRASGSSADSNMAVAPLGHVSRFFERRNLVSGATSRKPDSPSTITARASRKVAPISPTRFMRPDRTPSATHSAPARVLPAPRPPRNSQMRQSPGGGRWATRAQKSHPPSSRAATSSSSRLASSALLLEGGKAFIQSALQRGAGIRFMGQFLRSDRRTFTFQP